VATTTSIRTGLAVGRVEARGTAAGAAVLPSTVEASCLGAVRAYGTVDVATMRLTAVTGYILARGAMPSAVRSTAAPAEIEYVAFTTTEVLYANARQ
jgi:hypothetical protein